MSYNFDFNSIKTRITTSLQAKSSWAAALPYSVNARLIDAFCEEIQNLALYDDYLTLENKWSLAKNRSSLLSEQQLHRYQAHRKIGSFGLLRTGTNIAIQSPDWLIGNTYKADDTIFYSNILYKSLQNSNVSHQPDTSPTWWSVLDVSPSINVVIPKWTVFSNNGGDIKFTNYETYNLVLGQNYLDINVVQGTPKTYNVVAQGLDNEEFLLSEIGIENIHFELYINNVLWANVSNLLEYAGTDMVYEIENVIDFSGIYIKFGNDIYGKKLTNSDSISFKYISTLGSAGNITSSSIINKTDSTIYDISSNSVILYCNNRDLLSGGIDEEDIESIRLNAPKIFQTGDRASSADDYTEIVMSNFSFVLKASVWGAYEYNIDRGLDPWTFISSQENLVHLAIIDINSSNITNSEKLQISQSLNSFKAPTDIVTFETVRFLNLAFTVNAYVVNTSYILSIVQSSIRNTLLSNYSVSSLNLFQNIYFSDYQSLVDGVDGVDHHSTTVSIFYDFTLAIYYLVNLALPSLLIKPSSMILYVKSFVGTQYPDWTICAHDDGSGSFLPNAGFTLVPGSSMNYTTGVGLLAFATGLSDLYQDYKVRCFYQLQSPDLLLNSRTDIFKIDPNNLTVNTQYVRQ